MLSTSLKVQDRSNFRSGGRSLHPWLADIYHVCSSAKVENPKEEEDGGARTALPMGVSLPRSNDVGQKGLECV